MPSSCSHSSLSSFRLACDVVPSRPASFPHPQAAATAARLPPPAFSRASRRPPAAGRRMVPLPARAGGPGARRGGQARGWPAVSWPA